MKDIFRWAVAHVKVTLVSITLLAAITSVYAQKKEHLSYTGAGKNIQSDLLRFDPAVRKGTLANGFTYYIRHNETPKNRVVMYLVNKAGSILEDEDQRGLAHFMEHMSFNGTTHFPHNELEDYLQKSGVRFGADLNAYTSYDETVYELPIPSDKPAILASGIQIMRDWAHEALLDPMEIDKERGVVLEEKRLHKGPGQRLSDEYFPMLLNNSRYVNRMPIGIDTVLDNFKRPVIARFYNDWYRPDLQAIIVVGDVNVDEIEKAVKAKFSDLKNPAHERKRPAYHVALNGKNQFMALTDKEVTTISVDIFFKHQKQQLETVSDYRQYIMRNLLVQMLNERYQKLTIASNPPFLSCTGGIGRFLSNLDVFSVSMNPRPGQLQEGFQAAWQELLRLKEYGFTQPELDQAKKNFLSGLEAAVKEKDKTNSEVFVKDYQSNFLTGEAAPGIEKEYALGKADLESITLADLNKLSESFITDENRDILIQAPESEKTSLPGQATVSGWLKEIEDKPLTPYQEKVNTNSLLSAQPVPGHIVGEKKDDELGITTLILSNGIQVILKPTAFKNDEILISGFSKGGTSVYEDKDYQSAANAAGIIASCGAGNLDFTGLKQYLAGKQLEVQPFISDIYQGVQGRSTVKDFETALQLTYAYLTQPRRDANVFSSIISQSLAKLEHRDDEPQNVFADSAYAILFNHNFRASGPSVAHLKQVDLNRCYEIYKTQFANCNGMTFVIVGSFQPERVKPLLEKYLATLPSGSSQTDYVNRHINFATGKIEKNVYKGSEPRATVTLTFAGTYDYSRQHNMDMQALKEALQIRLLERLREEESGVYTPQVATASSRYPNSVYSFQISFACAPQNVDKLVASTLDEVAKLRNDGPLQVNLDKWKAEYAASMETQMKENTFWLQSIIAQLQSGLQLLPVDSYKERMGNVTPGEIKAMANKYLGGDNYIRLVLLPEGERPRIGGKAE